MNRGDIPNWTTGPRVEEIGVLANRRCAWRQSAIIVISNTGVPVCSRRDGQIQRRRDVLALTGGEAFVIVGWGHRRHYSRAVVLIWGWCCLTISIRIFRGVNSGRCADIRPFAIRLVHDEGPCSSHISRIATYRMGYPSFDTCLKTRRACLTLSI
jgi:hypothetical protein